MAVKLNKSGLEIIEDFVRYMKTAFDDESSRLIQLVKAQLPHARVDISHYTIRYSYARNVKEPAGIAHGRLISLADLLQFHRTGRFGNLDIRPADSSYAELNRVKGIKPLTYTTNTGTRPKSQDADHWDGGFVLDIDIRKALLGKEVSEAQHREFVGVLYEFRRALHERLCRYSWYLWTTVSSSLGGVHIRTKSGTRLYIKCLESYLRREGIDPQEDKLYALAHDINVVFKYAVCYHEMLCCADIFNRHYGRNDSAWFEDAVDKTAFGIEHGMFVSYDPELELNPNFKEVDFFVDLYDSDIARYDEWLNLPKVQNFLLQGINPFGRASAAAKTKHPAGAAPKIEAADESNDPDIDVELFRTKGPHLYETYNELSWRTAAFLYFEYTGENKERTMRLCRQLFDPASKQSREEKIKSNVESVIANRYPIDRSFRTFMQQVVGHKSEETKIAADLQQFEIAVPPENTYRLGADEYVGDYIEEAVAKCRRGQSLVLVSGTGTGKTEGIMRLVTRQAEGPDFGQERLPVEGNGKRMLIIEPLKSIVKSKFRKYEHLIEFVYEERIHRKEKDICVAIIDKVRDCVHLGTFQEPAFDYIVVDESHLLTMSEYRQKCGLLLDYLSNKSINSKIIYMTGTPVFERKFLPEDSVCVRFEKEPRFHKRVNIYPHYANALETMKRAIANEILRGRKVICILRQISHMRGIACKVNEYVRKQLGRDIRTDEFFAHTPDSVLARRIVEHKQLGEVDIAFVTSVFSVGLDIEGEDNAVIYTYQELNGVEVDQYANRLRHTDIEFNMYGRYPNAGAYRSIAECERSATALHNDALYAEALNRREDVRSLKRLREQAGIPYIAHDPAKGWYINETLHEIHRLYTFWDEWSRQYQVCAYYLRQMGYEVEVSGKKVSGIELPTAQEKNREQTCRRTEEYDRFMKIWTQHRDELERIYESLPDTSVRILQAETPLEAGEVTAVSGDETIQQQVIRTDEVRSLRSLLNFMRVSVCYKVPFADFATAVEQVLIHRRNKQLSQRQLALLALRLWWQYRADDSILKVIRRIDTLNPSAESATRSEEEYRDFLNDLIRDFWGDTQIPDLAQEQATFDKVVKAYYSIRRFATQNGFVTISPRLAADIEHSYLQLLETVPPQSSCWTPEDKVRLLGFFSEEEFDIV